MAALSFLWRTLITILYLSAQTLSQQCLVVFVAVDIIEPGLDAADWEGTYTTDGSTTSSGCLSYTTSQGATLEYHSSSWSVRSVAHEFISYATTASSPCNPPLSTNLWKHGTDVNESTLTITCSYTSSPTFVPTANPTFVPTAYPTTSSPSSNPTLEPTQNPTKLPTQFPSFEPTQYPTAIPSEAPTPAPTANPSFEPSAEPTAAPSFAPISAPTIAPTQDCSRIILLTLSNPDGVNPGSRIDGIYYQVDYKWPVSGYPWYQQHKAGSENQQLPSNHIYITFEGYWTITDVSNDLQLQYRENFVNPTLHVPPHSPAIGDGWTVVAAPNTFWEILIECTSMTDNPTTHPTFEPTVQPTFYPTTEPTIEPTTEQPSFFPTTDPIQSTYSTLDEKAGAEATFLDTFNILEWAIIAAVLLLCCIVIASLYIWRSRKVQQWRDEEAAHLLSAKSQSADMVEMSPQRTRPKSLNFRHSKQNTADLEADFASALAVVGQHKSQKSLNIANEKKGYEVVEARPATPDDTQTEDRLVKSYSELYGNHPVDDIYSYTFITKPFGMEWKTTKTDKKNLYVSKVQQASQAALGEVRVGSKLISFNGEMIEDLGAKQIYGKLAISDMPLTITFLKPFRKEEDKEGDNYGSSAPPPVMAPPVIPPHTPPPNMPEYAADAGVASDTDTDGSGGDALIPPEVPPIPPKVPSIGYADDEEEEYEEYEDEEDPFAPIGPPPIPVIDDGDQGNDAVMEKAQALIPEVFDDYEDPEESRSSHAID